MDLHWFICKNRLFNEPKHHQINFVLYLQNIPSLRKVISNGRNKKINKLHTGQFSSLSVSIFSFWRKIISVMSITIVRDQQGKRQVNVKWIFVENVYAGIKFKIHLCETSESRAETIHCHLIVWINWKLTDGWHNSLFKKRFLINF